jgi:biopolymer transport protein ExbB/TolQ
MRTSLSAGTDGPTPSGLRKLDFKLNWGRSDVEQRLGFTGGRFTSVNRVFTLIIALILTLGFFGLVTFGLKPLPAAAWIAAMFLDRGPTQYAAMFLFFWALSMLWVKSLKIRFQERALSLSAVPQQPDFVLTAETAQSVLRRLHDLVDSTAHFLLLNRIERALSNLNNIGRVGDVSTILKTQAEFDEGQASSSYSIIIGFVWAIPVLGFIGTVLGLSTAIGKFSVTLQAGGDMTAIRQSLEGVIGGLSTAFETTLVALVAALIVQLALVYVQSRESEFLDECNDYCHSHILSRLRLGVRPIGDIDDGNLVSPDLTTAPV